jgi:hypothetical protein
MCCVVGIVNNLATTVWMNSQVWRQAKMKRHVHQVVLDDPTLSKKNFSAKSVIIPFITLSLLSIFFHVPNQSVHPAYQPGWWSVSRPHSMWWQPSSVLLYLLLFTHALISVILIVLFVLTQFYVYTLILNYACTCTCTLYTLRAINAQCLHTSAHALHVYMYIHLCCYNVSSFLFFTHVHYAHTHTL